MTFHGFYLILRVPGVIDKLKFYIGGLNIYIIYLQECVLVDAIFDDAFPQLLALFFLTSFYIYIY